MWMTTRVVASYELNMIVNILFNPYHDTAVFATLVWRDVVISWHVNQYYKNTALPATPMFILIHPILKLKISIA